MGKSNYPNQIDTSVEIPTVRNNITEIGSDALNSYKSAILAIERALGVNPHGSTGNTVAARLNRSLDSTGNILPSAIIQAGVLTGPVTNNEVAESAAINESKLNLNFPTQLLQDEISMLNGEISAILLSLSELSTRFAVHVHPSAINRHKALAISVDGNTSVPSDIATLNLETNSLQDVLEEIYNSHINYSGENISSINNSHSASQIYFDNTVSEEFIDSNDVQGAIDEIANTATAGMVDNILNLNSNGIVRTGSVFNGFEGNRKGTILLDSVTVTYTQAGGESRTTFVFSTNPTPIYEISKFDILSLSGSSNDDDDTDYQIAEVVLDISNNVESITVFGGPKAEAITGLTAIIYRNKYQGYNLNGLNSAVRPREAKTNTPDIQLANPNSATIISENINPTLITSTVNKFNIIIDEGTAITIETYDSNLSEQSLDSIVNIINEQSVDQRLNILAYKFRDSNCFELAISHNIPNFSGDIQSRTLRIEVGDSDDGSGALGFTDILSEVFEGNSGNDFLINGRLNSEFGQIQTFTESNLDLVVGTRTISLVNDTVTDLGLRIGDLLIISGADDSGDDGTYRISLLNDLTITLDGTYVFTGSLNENSAVYILRTTAPIGELTFEEVGSSTGSILFDVFVTEDLDVHYSKRMEVDGELRSSGFIATIIDVSKNFIISGETATLEISADGIANIIDPNLISGPEVFVGRPGDYTLLTNDGFSFVSIRVGTASLPSTDISITLYGFDEISSNNFLVSRGIFSNSLGRILGYPTEIGVPAVIDKRQSGTTNENIISASLLEKYIEGPRNELRGSGVIRGCEVVNVQLFFDYQTFDVTSGVVVVNGIRIEFPGFINFRIDSTSNFFAAIDSYGCLIAGEFIDNPDGYTVDGDLLISPFFDKNIAYLASVETQSIYDLRLFLDHLDYKVTKDIIVSNDQRFAHFTDINTAVNYAKRFSGMFPNTGTPNIYIREGLYLISSPIIIDFDLKISGAGPSTIIRKTGSLATGVAPISGNAPPLSCVFYLGNVFSNISDEINYGIDIQNLTYETSSSIANVGSFITLAERSISTRAVLFSFKNITCIGPETIDFGAGVDADQVGEYAIIVGFADTTTFVPEVGPYGNIIIKNCFFKYMGLEYGPCLLRDGATMGYHNIIANENIGKILSPGLGITDFEVFEVVSSATLLNVIEVSNIKI